MMDEVRDLSNYLMNYMVIKEMGFVFTPESWEERVSSSIQPKFFV